MPPELFALIVVVQVVKSSVVLDELDVKLSVDIVSAAKPRRVNNRAYEMIVRIKLSSYQQGLVWKCKKGAGT